MALASNLVDRLIDKVKKNVGRSGDTTLDDYVIEYLNNAQKKVCNKANFWFMHQNTTIAFTQSDNTEALPSNFKDEDSVWLEVTVGSTTSWIELEYAEWEDIRRDFDSTNENEPSHYIIQQKNLIVYPIPSAAYTVRLDYYGYLSDLTDPGVSTNDLLTDYPDVLEAWATHKAFRKLREFDESGRWFQQFELEMKDLVVANAERELPNEMVLRVRTDVRGTGIKRIRGRIR